MTIEQAFEILEITDRNIDELSLKKAFREAARNTHPDSNPSDGAEEKFRLINEAYDILLPEIRKRDRLRQERIKRAEKARRVENAKRTGSASDSTKAWEQPKNSQTRQTDKDRWDYYAEADRKYNEEREKHARERVDEALRKKERLEALRQAQEKWERERAERMEREKETPPPADSGEVTSDEHKIIDFVKQPLGLESILVIILSVFTLGIIIAAPFAGAGGVSRYSKYISTAMCWVIIVVVARKITDFSRKYFRGKIELIIVFLVALELGLSLLKLIDMALNGMKTGLVAVLVIVVALLVDCSYYKPIRESLKSDIKLQRVLAVFIVIATLAVALAGIILGIIGLL